MRTGWPWNFPCSTFRWLTWNLTYGRPHDPASLMEKGCRENVRLAPKLCPKADTAQIFPSVRTLRPAGRNAVMFEVSQHIFLRRPCDCRDRFPDRPLILPRGKHNCRNSLLLKRLKYCCIGKFYRFKHGTLQRDYRLHCSKVPIPFPTAKH